MFLHLFDIIKSMNKLYTVEHDTIRKLFSANIKGQVLPTEH
jgi:hypothetical protein